MKGTLQWPRNPYHLQQMQWAKERKKESARKKENNMTESAKYSLTRADLVKVGKGMLVSVGGVVAAAAALALADQLSALPDQVDFGVYQGVVVVLCSTLVNGIRKWITDSKTKN